MKLARYMRDTPKAQFHMYSLDTYGPGSKFSLHWEILFETTMCPPKLVDVHTLYWKGKSF